MGVVHEALSQDIELSMGRHDRGVLDGLIRQWRSADADGKAAIAGEFRELLAAEDIKRRSAAVLFFERLPADDDGALLAEVEANPGRFEHQPDPWFGSGELRVLVAVALSRRMRTEAERDFVRGEAQRPHLGHRVVPGLLDTDRDWALSHVADVVKATPEALAAYVHGVTDDELTAVAAAARGALLPEVFEGVLAHHVADENLRTRALGA
ncbi:MAG: hypothetical protein EP330_03990 [Deltaproteobacteria bacterium]|nr:MAG: hypothetical protein EP330_03990 [Deltaproteobacteria bacterium]